jgi:hypothetical protein
MEFSCFFAVLGCRADQDKRSEPGEATGNANAVRRAAGNVRSEGERLAIFLPGNSDPETLFPSTGRRIRRAQARPRRSQVNFTDSKGANQRLDPTAQRLEAGDVKMVQFDSILDGENF